MRGGSDQAAAGRPTHRCWRASLCCRGSWASWGACCPDPRSLGLGNCFEPCLDGFQARPDASGCPPGPYTWQRKDQWPRTWAWEGGERPGLFPSCSLLGEPCTLSGPHFLVEGALPSSWDPSLTWSLHILFGAPPRPESGTPLVPGRPSSWQQREHHEPSYAGLNPGSPRDSSLQ